MTDAKKVTVSADKHTRGKLDIQNEVVSEQEAQRIQDSIKDSNEFKTIMEKDRLVVKRVLRD